MGLGRQPTPDAKRPHVGPDDFDVVQAGVLGASRALLMPTARQRTVGQPDRVLFLVIIHDKELAGVFVLGHGFLLKTLGE
jgi:hypothetical protein